MQVPENLVVSILVQVDSTKGFYFVVCKGNIGVKQELVVLDIAMDVYFPKEMDWCYTIFQETFEYYINQIFEQD